MWGSVDENGTGKGIFGDLTGRRADVGYGGLNQWYELLPFLSFSKPIQRDSLSCLTPKPT